ncbi:putative HMP/thiamine permease protein YkoC [Lentilactobacillus parabuchneri]|jgi:energy-coupling factor transport system permease protein|uniref:Energy-coupling factor transporter transmembrane protein EcfT n=2 Tax=Lentilactobacillus parabuchneri TaxID=152331 RepID=A0A1X1FED4_9LACO|nr:energy-coupling factor transporter transmembrane component T [Lentilactobacillus parabuchneri]APR07630.1 Putative HMP/thiamine permease protein YkoC [Lentilactobacillus parabuchneri]KRM46039.1 ABC transporter [Lentilactobacillus parabuchneri DSM 5707 = NBRC 107865]KRN72826.1 ABC transporter [Lentilactobacillus parabuchneri]MBW0222894.1 energy-coupling factor transporter transmembrane protein EcfT [Lentilactobacillus parabuchneri]MBW0246003.1 energy-coupling factor transporter transmembrane 
MNPGMKLLLVMIIALEISFTQSLTVNIILIGVSLIYILLQRVHMKALFGLLFWPLFPALGLFVSQWLYGSAGIHFAWILFTRIYAYVFLGATFTLTSSITDLSLTLEQDFRLPAKFAYGVLAAFNLMPKITEEIRIIKTSALMRGQALHFWSPKLYFKSILSSIQWSQNLAEAMTSHGFVEDQARTHYKVIRITAMDWILFVGLLVIVQALLYFLRY